MHTNDTPSEYLKLVATRAAEAIGSVASRATLTDPEREAFMTTEQVCAEIAIGRRA
jgi:hypothetical protein